MYDTTQQSDGQPRERARQPRRASPVGTSRLIPRRCGERAEGAVALSSLVLRNRNVRTVCPEALASPNTVSISLATESAPSRVSRRRAGRPGRSLQFAHALREDEGPTRGGAQTARGVTVARPGRPTSSVTDGREQHSRAVEGALSRSRLGLEPSGTCCQASRSCVGAAARRGSPPLLPCTRLWWSCRHHGSGRQRLPQRRGGRLRRRLSATSAAVAAAAAAAAAAAPRAAAAAAASQATAPAPAPMPAAVVPAAEPAVA
eukprot:365338-Chlamydomonas_euryale.AAC.15